MGILICTDCKIDRNEYGYMIKDSLWNQITAIKKASLLCIGCLEQRLGRQLKGDDFKQLPINSLSIPFKRSDRLINRLLQCEQNKF